MDSAVYLSFGSAFGGLPDEVTRRFDIVGFDPRGVSRSYPVKCVADADLDATFGFEPDPESQAEFDELRGAQPQDRRGCGDKYGEGLRLFATEQAARDMDAIRAAVGDEKLTYLGYSYGTLLGATYAQLFPRNVRAMVLDGAVDPKQDWSAGSESQAKGFERAFTNFTDWCRRNARPLPDRPGRPHGGDRGDREGPGLAGTRREGPRGDRRLGLLRGDLLALHRGRLGEAGRRHRQPRRAATRRDRSELADAYAERDADGKYTNLFDANLAVNCADEDTKVERSSGSAASSRSGAGSTRCSAPRSRPAC